MSEIIFFILGFGAATAVWWWRWKSSADERTRLQAKVEQLKAQITEKFE